MFKAAQLSINEGVVHRVKDGLTYIIHTKSRSVLHGIANEIWELIINELNFEQIVDAISSKYNVDKSVVKADVNYTLTHLYEQQIIKLNNQLLSLAENSGKSKEQNSLSNFYETLDTLYKVVMEITYSCNNRCEYCYNGEYKENVNLTFEKIKEIVDECKKIGVMHISLTGGEPFFRPDLMDIVEYIHNNNFYITIQTNGTLIDDSIASQLARYMPINILVTVHSADSDVHDSFTKVKGSHNKTINGVRALRKHNVPVLLRHVVTSKNIDGIDAYIQLAKELDVRYNISPLLYPNVDKSAEPLKLRVNSEQIETLIKKSYYYPQEDPCGAGKIKVVISPEGTVYPCPFYHIEMGNINNVSLADIINSEKASNIRNLFVKPVECQTCNMSKNCPRCPVIASHETGNFQDVNPFDCMTAQCYENVIREKANAK